VEGRRTCGGLRLCAAPYQREAARAITTKLTGGMMSYDWRFDDRDFDRHGDRPTRTDAGGAVRRRQPGRWMVHCHNGYHADAGMMTMIGYRA
jgi:FtsP/CotA-like multicopper oxidase with cupredoxin domain